MLENIIKPFTSYFLELLSNGGYSAVFLLSIADRFFLSLVPTEVVLPAVGVLIGKGKFAVMPVILFVTLGNLVGDLFLYWISALGGRWFLEKYGRYFFVSKHDLEHTDKLFAKHGGKLIIVGRLLPIVRTFVAFPAGVVRMPVWKFTLFSVVGFMPWNLFLIFAGFKLNENWQKIEKIFDKMEIFVAGAIALILVWYIYRHFKKKHLIHE